jgi:hypothetical protein
LDISKTIDYITMRWGDNFRNTLEVYAQQDTWYHVESRIQLPSTSLEIFTVVDISGVDIKFEQDCTFGLQAFETVKLECQ